MFDQPRTLEEFRADLDAKLTSAVEEHRRLTQLLGSLPAGMPEIVQLHAFGYCASFTLLAKGEGMVKRLLALLPPLPLADIAGPGWRTQKPVKCLQESEDVISHPLYPVLFKTESPAPSSIFKKASSNGAVIAQWWTETPHGDLMVTVAGLGPNEGQPGPLRFKPESFQHSTGKTRYFSKRLDTPETVPSPLQAWHAAWGQFKVNMGMNGLQKTFLFALKAQVERTGLPVTHADLPEPNYLQAGTAVAFGPDESLLEGLENLTQKQRARPDHWFDRMGDFWRSFSSVEVNQMLAFINMQMELLPAAVKAQDQAFGQIEVALQDVFKDWAAPSSVRLDHFRELIGPAVFSRCGWTPRLQVESDSSRVSVWVRLGNEEKKYDYPVKLDGKPFTVESLKVEYL